jgi:hypothetical protein
MPVMQAKTVASKEVWKKGNLTIFELTLSVNGQDMRAKTYSGAIAQVGWSGTVETYEKEGRNGSETFVKQPQKEDSVYAPQSGGQGKSGGASKPFDQFTMYLSYAKDLVVALQETAGFDQKLFKELLVATIEGGNMLYNNRPEVAGVTQPTTQSYEPVDEDLKGLNAIFGDDERGNYVVDGEETPWNSKR